MQQQINEENLQVIVEHMEEYLFNWCLYQYLNMKQYLSKWNCTLIISNCRAIDDYNGPNKQENFNNLAILKTQFTTTKTILMKESILKSDPYNYLKQGNVCLLDMRGQKELCCQQKWKTVIFGGILGDHPPRDRTSPLRKCVSEMRHLGSLQLATDTAVLVTRLVLKNKLKLSQIPMIKEPTIKGLNKNGEKTVVQMEGFSYISKMINIDTGKIIQGLTQKQKKKIYMHKEIQNLLLNEDLECQKLM